MCPNAPTGRCRRHVLPRPSSRARRVPHLPWTNTPFPCRCNRHIGNAFHLTALTNIANSPWHGELLSARAGADKTTRCALTAAVHRRSGGEVLLLAYRGRPNGHLISGQVGVNGAMIESPGCALRTDSKGIDVADCRFRPAICVHRPFQPDIGPQDSKTCRTHSPGIRQGHLAHRERKSLARKRSGRTQTAHDEGASVSPSHQWGSP
jgi:hypothetical protein